MNFQEMFFDELEIACEEDYRIYLGPFVSAKEWDENPNKRDNPNYWEYYQIHTKYLKKEPISYDEFVQNRLKYIVRVHPFPQPNRRVGG